MNFRQISRKKFGVPCVTKPLKQSTEFKPKARVYLLTKGEWKRMASGTTQARVHLLLISATRGHCRANAESVSGKLNDTEHKSQPLNRRVVNTIGRTRDAA